MCRCFPISSYHVLIKSITRLSAPISYNFAQFCKEDEREDGKAGPLLCVEVNIAIVPVALVKQINFMNVLILVITMMSVHKD